MQETAELTTQSPPAPPSEMARSAEAAAAYLKTLAHEGRLMILCHLGSGEKSVGELEDLLDIRQAAVSEMVASLREDGLVTTRREGKTIYYSLADNNTYEVISLLYRLFCSPEGKDTTRTSC
ncbi:MAG: ArsR/SmtB family transcription factor [Paracoccaceae bacterium]